MAKPIPPSTSGGAGGAARGLMGGLEGGAIVSPVNNAFETRFTKESASEPDALRRSIEFVDRSRAGSRIVRIIPFRVHGAKGSDKSFVAPVSVVAEVAFDSFEEDRRAAAGGADFALRVTTASAGCWSSAPSAKKHVIQRRSLRSGQCRNRIAVQQHVV